MKLGTLIFFCGKMGSGKSTLSKQLVKELNGVLFSEDDWLAALYPTEIKTFDDYIKYSSRLKPLLSSLICEILKLGNSVVMDFPGNTRNLRKYFKSIIQNSGVDHKLIYLKASDEVCQTRLARRRIESPERAHFDTEAVFHRVTGFFQEPREDEGFEVEIIPQR